MTMIKFTKMNGLGNDFVILDYSEYEKTNSELPILAEKLCDRHFGIGADGLIVVNSKVENADIGWFFYNSDGSIAQMCGNGIRCFARYVYDNKLCEKKEFSVETLAGTIIPKINPDNTITVNMNKPVLIPEKIPVNTSVPLNFNLTTSSKEFSVNAVGMGNPHCVIFTEEDGKSAARTYGPEIETNSVFPQKTNVEFIKILSRKEINLDVWERGCGITTACGTGACASVVAGILNGLLDNKVRVNLPGGTLTIEWAGNSLNTDVDIFMTGPAVYSFCGEINV